MDYLRRIWSKATRLESGIAIVVCAGVVLQLIFFVEYIFASKGITEEARHRAEAELRVKNLEIQKVMVAVETAIVNTVWAAERTLEQPDSLYPVLRRMVAQNEAIVGAGLMFRPNHYPQKGLWYEPYVAERADGSMEEAQIGSPTHDYLQADFYKNGLQAACGIWSEPYYDNAGAKMMLCTYTIPVHNTQGETVALLGADVSLDWLSNVINASHIYPSSFNVVISRKGLLLVCPEDSLILSSTIQDVTASSSDTMTRHINEQQMSGKSGHQDLKDLDGNEISVYYAPVDGETGWSMSVVCSKDEIYAGLREDSQHLTLLMLAGIALLIFITYRTARSAHSLEKATAERERIGSELRIAADIQESMLPKVFPPFPERNDIDIRATLVPAKEIGGDLYDFHIRDEKLFFCIGDVSGKGVPASLVMAVTRSLFRTTTAHEDLPANIVKAINSSMAEMNDRNMFVTLFVGALDLRTGLLRYCNAGHEEPLLIGKGLRLMTCDENIPIGIMQDWDYTGQETLIDPATTIFLYTDGLTEAEDTNHAQFGKKRMVEAARQSLDTGGQSDPDTLIALLADALHEFVAGAEQSDDLTLLAIGYKLRQA